MEQSLETVLVVGTLVLGTVAVLAEPRPDPRVVAEAEGQPLAELARRFQLRLLLGSFLFVGLLGIYLYASYRTLAALAVPAALADGPHVYPRPEYLAPGAFLLAVVAAGLAYDLVLRLFLRSEYAALEVMQKRQMGGADTRRVAWTLIGGMLLGAALVTFGTRRAVTAFTPEGVRVGHFFLGPEVLPWDRVEQVHRVAHWLDSRHRMQEGVHYVIHFSGHDPRLDDGRYLTSRELISLEARFRTKGAPGAPPMETAFAYAAAQAGTTITDMKVLPRSGR
jgi:hypothetical protein